MAVLAGLNIYSIKCQPFCKLSFVHSCLTDIIFRAITAKTSTRLLDKKNLERKFACRWDGALFFCLILVCGAVCIVAQCKKANYSKRLCRCYYCLCGVRLSPSAVQSMAVLHITALGLSLLPNPHCYKNISIHSSPYMP